LRPLRCQRGQEFITRLRGMRDAHLAEPILKAQEQVPGPSLVRGQVRVKSVLRALLRPRSIQDDAADNKADDADNRWPILAKWTGGCACLLALSRPPFGADSRNQAQPDSLQVRQIPRGLVADYIPIPGHLRAQDAHGDKPI